MRNEKLVAVPKLVFVTLQKMKDYLMGQCSANAQQYLESGAVSHGDALILRDEPPNHRFSLGVN
jgi:hypothetical protein